MVPIVAIVVDTGPLYALADSSDTHHRAVEALVAEAADLLIVPSPVLTELCYLVGSRLGSQVEAKVLRSVLAGEGGLQLEHPSEEDLERSAELIASYADTRLGFVDACVVALAERLRVRTLFTLDRRHFGIIRPRHRESFEIAP